MSGIEVAGLALGAFPLLLEGAKGLHNQATKAQFYWKFRTKFQIFLQDIERESIAYDQILRILLDQLNLTSDEQAKFLNVEDQDLSVHWRTRRLDAQVRRRFKKREVEWLGFQISRVQEALQGLRELLSTHKAYQIDAHDFDSQLFKITTSFFSKKDELFSRLAQGNKDIFDFLDRTSRIGTSGRSEIQGLKPHQKQLQRLQTIQKQAKSLYNCFQRHLSCDCNTGHPCGVTIQKLGKDSRDDRDIMVMFNPLAESEHLRVRIEVKDSVIMSTRESQTIANAEYSNHIELTRLTQQVATKNAQKRAVKTVGSLTKLVESATAVLGVLPGSSSEHQGEVEKQPKRLTKTPMPKVSDVTSPITDMTSLKSGATSPVSDNSATKKISEPPSAASSQMKDSESKLRVDMAEDQIAQQSGFDNDIRTKTIPIKNLCQSIACGPHLPCLGYLDGDDQTRVYLHAEVTNPTTDRVKFDSLHSALKDGVSRPERLKIALIAAFLVGGMGESPWLKPEWTSGDFYLWTESENTAYQPYFLHSSLLHTLHKSTKLKQTSQGRTNLYLLGVILLELVFGERLEDQPIRGKYLGKDGIPNEMTDFCTAVEWKTKAQQEVGFRIADGIGWCLGCLHGPPQDIGSSECLKNISQNVISPLEEFLKQWFEDPVS